MQIIVYKCCKYKCKAEGEGNIIIVLVKGEGEGGVEKKVRGGDEEGKKERSRNQIPSTYDLT